MEGHNIMAPNNIYQIYIDNTINLASTIIIKSTDAEAGLNQLVNDTAMATGGPGVNMLDKTTWKYYRNLSGNYHALDTPMQVVSLDNLQMIDFTVANLKVHVATAAGYQYGSRLYKTLLAQYPTQELLIKGILYPVDLQTAINAKDGQILGYPANLVESNEYSLIPKLQKWIDGFKIRWYNTQFSISDSLYPTTALGIMYLNLVPAILNIRLEACRTKEAHSFHVRQYLASHGFLDNYIDNMTTKQALFFYRNISYIERNAGSKDTFRWLIDNVMTARNLPLAEYLMVHDISALPNNLYPNLTFVKQPLNNVYGVDTGVVFNLTEVLGSEDLLARDNILYKSDYIPMMQESMENSLSGELRTKVLESSVIDNTDSAPYTLSEILLNHWIYLSNNGTYTAYVNVNNPKTGEIILLTVAEAFILTWYVFCSSVNIVPVNIPPVLATRVQRIMNPPTINSLGNKSTVVSIAELMSVVDSKLVPQSVAQQALSMQPEIVNIISTGSFYDLCTRIYSAAQMQRNLVASQQYSNARAMTMNMVSRIYSDNVCTLSSTGETYANWLATRNINVAGLTLAELGTLYSDLVRNATGMNLHTTTSLGDMQKAMLGIMSQLSSYSVQYIGMVNGTAMKKSDWTAIRVNSILNTMDDTGHVSDFCAEIRNATAAINDTIKITGSIGTGPLDSTAVNAVISDHLKLTIPPVVNGVLSTTVNAGRFDIGGVEINPVFTPITNNGNITPVPGIEYYLAMTPAQQSALRDIYSI